VFPVIQSEKEKQIKSLCGMCYFYVYCIYDTVEDYLENVIID
jgi:hypothetical protein